MESFYEPAAFLLKMQFPNLFEQADRDGIKFRCVGCQEIVNIWEREKHFNHHRGIRRRQETMRQARIRRERIARLEKARAER
jgi:hypothetical protein